VIPALDLAGVRVEVRLAGGRRLRVLEDVSLTLGRGEILAIVGESGSGKSTLARTVGRLVPHCGGDIRVGGCELPELDYRRAVQLVLQDPFASLNPMRTVAYHLERALRRHRRMHEGAVAELLTTVGLVPPERFAPRRPHELSGGQRQRVALARALAAGPEILVADEPTSMLDASLRKDMLALLERLRDERGLSILLITHDLASARWLAGRIAVLYAGRVVEIGRAETLAAWPSHPYTQLLLAAVRELSGGPPAPAASSLLRPAETGCAFAPRCPHAEPRCREERPLATEVTPGHFVRCHLVRPN
jgi:oligopeptide/dipeptide ABC transporter ATP-binding protein